MRRIRESPEGKYRVLGVDTFSNEDWLVGDFDTQTEALAVAEKRGGTMTMMYVYDDRGRCLGHYGTF